MNKIFSFGKKTLLFLCGGAAVMCFSCGEQKSSQEKQLYATKQDSVIVSNEVASKDTIDIEMALQREEALLNDLKSIHITKASDTIMYKNLERQYEELNHLEIRDVIFEEQKHSIKVKYLEHCVSLLEEIIRIDDELRKVGLKGHLKDNERRDFQESLAQFKQKLWLETH